MDKIEMLRNIKLSKNFSALEFANTLDGHAIMVPNLELVTKLQSLRDLVGPINITSGYRTPEFNKSIGGSSNSFHVQGLAADIQFDFRKFTVDQIIGLCVGIGFSNIGVYLTKGNVIRWVHVDTGRRWNDNGGWVHIGNSAVKIYHV
jgi:uncharacterized protein YcbK (DUF882 family)